MHIYANHYAAFYDASPHTITAKINFMHPFGNGFILYRVGENTFKALKDMSNKQELIHVQTTSKLMRKRKKA